MPFNLELSRVLSTFASSFAENKGGRGCNQLHPKQHCPRQLHGELAKSEWVPFEEPDWSWTVYLINQKRVQQAQHTVCTRSDLNELCLKRDLFLVPELKLPKGLPSNSVIEPINKIRIKWRSAIEDAPVGWNPVLSLCRFPCNLMEVVFSSSLEESLEESLGCKSILF